MLYLYSIIVQVAFKAHHKYIIKQFINYGVHSKVKQVIYKLVYISVRGSVEHHL